MMYSKNRTHKITMKKTISISKVRGISTGRVFLYNDIATPTRPYPTLPYPALPDPTPLPLTDPVPPDRTLNDTTMKADGESNLGEHIPETLKELIPSSN